MKNEDFIKEVDKHLSKKSDRDDIIRVCEKLERIMPEGSVNENFYQELYDLFKDSMFQYLEFKLQLRKKYDLINYKKKILKREDDWMLLVQEKFQTSLDKLQPFVLSRFDDLSEEQKKSLAWDIADGIKEFAACKDITDKLTSLYKDLNSLKDLEKKDEDSRISKIKIYQNSGKTITINSQIIMKLLQDDFYDSFSIGRLPLIPLKADIRKRIDELSVTNNYLPTLAIRTIVEILIKKNLLPETKNDSNNVLGFTDDSGHSFALPDSTAITIYNIIRVLDFGKQKNDSDDMPINNDDPDRSKAAYVRSKLETSAGNDKYNIDIKSLLSEYERYIILSFGE